jgi:hypothetical protein
MVHEIDFIEPDQERHEEYQYYVDKYCDTYPQLCPVYVILIFLVTLLVRLNEVNLVDHLCGRLGEILEQASADSSYCAP